MASLIAITGTVVATAPASAAPTVDVYSTEGVHHVNGHTWSTKCEPYSVTTRCRTEIQATVVTYSNGAFRTRTGWAFNNMTYLPAPRSVWAGNPLAETKSWKDSSGRSWRTECDTAATGRGACRSFAQAKVIAKTASGYQWRTQWVFNSMTRFTTGSGSTGTTPPSTTPPTTTPNSGDWPNESNTGVPAGVTLTRYTGPMTITTPNTVIRNALVTGTLNIQAPGVQIINTRINGGVDLRDPKGTNNSFTIVDSEVHIGDNLNTGLMRGNFHANRVEITGGRRSMYCVYNCVIENSYVHAQGGDPGGNAHFSGIRMEQNAVIRHNTITCEAQRGSGTGCSAGLTGYGDFAPVQNNLIENNLFTGGGGGGSTICAYGGSSGNDGSKPYGNQARDIRFINNVFVRGASGQCGNLGAVKSFDATRPGNVWRGNTWDNGATINSNGR